MPVETTKIKIDAAGTLLSQDGIGTLGQLPGDVLDDADAREVVALASRVAVLTAPCDTGDATIERARAR